ncbi:MAG: ATP-binding protein [Saprospiraceae bacterium]
MIFIFLFSIGFTTAQNVKIDSLALLLSAAQEDTTEIKLLNEISWEYHRSDIKQCSVYAQLALTKSLELDYLKGEGRSLNLLAMHDASAGRQDLAIEKNLASLAIGKSINDLTIVGSAANDLGLSYDYLSDRHKAMEYYQEALEASVQIQDTLGMVFSLGNMSVAHRIEGNLKASEEYLLRSIELAQQSNDNMVLSGSYLDMGYLELDKKAYDKAMTCFTKAKKIAQQTGDKLIEGEALLAQAMLFQDNKQLEIAEKQAFEAILIYETLGSQDFLLNAYYTVGDISLAKKENEQALRFAKKGLDLGVKMDLVEYQVGFLKLIAKSYEALYDIESAYKYQKQYQVMTDSVYTIKKSEKVLELENKYQLANRLAENKLLREEKAKKEAIIQKGNILNYATVFILLLMTILAIVLWKNFKHHQSYNTILEKEVKERTQALEKSNEQLKVSNEELERFAFIASHDLKEPLRNISGFTKLIDREVKQYENGSLGEYLSIVESNSRQMYNLIEDVLEYSRMKKNYSLEQVDLNLLLKQIRLNLADQLNARNAILEVENLPVIEANRTQIFQLMKNLIENGVKYNESEVPRVTVRYQSNNDFHQFIIGDNGIGIEEKYQDQIFLMFKRLHNRSAYEGSGLGLSIVKKIVENLGGNITLKSKPGEGCKFTIEIPLKIKVQAKEEIVDTANVVA